MSRLISAYARTMLTALAALAILAPSAGLAQPPAEIAAKIQKQYESLKDTKADFNQELKNIASGETEKRSGSIYYRNPNLLRWETSAPEKELLLLTRDVVWNYFAEEKTAYKYPAEDVLNSRTMLRFLSGKARLDEDFEVGSEGPEEDGTIRLRLAPRNPEPNLVLAHVWVDPNTFLIKQIAIRDFYGNTNKLTLRNLAVNPGLSPDLFAFTPPAGVKVMDNAKQ